MSDLKNNTPFNLGDLVAEIVSIFSHFTDSPLLPANQVNRYNTQTTKFFNEYNRRQNIVIEHNINVIPDFFRS